MRTKVTGYLTQKRGLYYVVLNMPSNVKGKRIRKTLSTGLSTERNTTKAKEVLREMIREANAGEEVHGIMERKAAQSAAPESSAPRPDMLFSDYLQFWLQWKRSTWEEVTYSGYAANVNRWIAPYFLERRTKLNEINVLDIEMFYAHEKNTRNISGNTVAHYHANIHKALVDAVRLKLIPHNPASDVERPKKDNFVAGYYTADELIEMFPVFAGTKLELPVLLAAYYGLRRSEVVGLKWSAIDFVNKTITISHTFERVRVDGKIVDVSKERTKNNSSFRTLPLMPEVENALTAEKAHQENQQKQCGRSYCKKYLEYICVDGMGNLVNPNYISGNFSNILRKNGLRPIRFHDLRHSCASLLIKNKIPMKDVQVWMGHSSFATTANIYAHIDTDSKQEAADTIASRISLSGASEKADKKSAPKRSA